MSNRTKEPFQNFIEKIIDFRGRTPKKLNMDWGNGDIRALSANNVEMGKINFEKECYLGSEELYKKWMNRGDCQKSDVVMTMEAPLGNVAQIPDDKKYILSQRTVLFKTKKDKILNDYFFYLLSGEEFQRELQNNATGTTAKGIQQKKLLKINLDVPKSTDTQDKISTILKTVDNSINKTHDCISKLQNIKSGLMQDLFTRGVDENGKLRPSFKEKPELYKDSPLGMIPKDWAYTSIGSATSLVIDGPHVTPTYVETGVPFVTVRNIITGNLSLENTQKITQKDYSEFCKRGKPEIGDILYAKDGSIGQTCVVDTDIEFSFFVSVALIKLNRNKLSPCFTNNALQSFSTQKQVNILSEGSGLKHMVLRSIKALIIPMPDLAEQERIESILLQINAQIKNVQDELGKYKKVKSGLMQDLLTGNREVKVDA